MGLLSKRAVSILNMKEHKQLFACPVCKEGMSVSDTGKVTCINNHSFDIAKQGYINFMTKPVNSMYSKELFEARQRVIASGLYDDLQRKIAAHISGTYILDTGCGEGSHLARICEKVEGSVGVGIDIAKEGILSAAKFYDGHIWCVGDLASSPYSADTFDVILNILSPANYDEFKRLLKPDGKVIKVVPQEGYLKELRQQAFAHSEKESYTNALTLQRFKESFERVEVERIHYTVPLSGDLVPKLLEMTPMGWHIENKEAIRLSEITVDVNILIGTLK
ncbi:putative RNA methyltransferase [Lysinibacillus sp. 54212]|uniref:putative RNA methyltransferase n=1 Tax=Lysinibacillus sp. 54212 TaxID=3119829 RepID=UPI002FCA7240